MKKSSYISPGAPIGQGLVHRATSRYSPPEEVIDRLAGVFALLSNQTRLRIVMALRPDGCTTAPELCVCDLAELINASESMTSHQLRLLREGGLVTQRREGKLVRYRLAAGPIAHLLVDGLSYVSR